MYIHCFVFCFEIQRQESEIDTSVFLNPAFVFFRFRCIDFIYGSINV